MFGNGRSDDQIKTELEYLREYVGRVFGKPLVREAFQAQIQDIIDQKIHDYVYQRYRDWTAPELARLKDQWQEELECRTQPMTVEVSAPRRGRPPKVEHTGRV
jgi:hypothetical protein